METEVDEKEVYCMHCLKLERKFFVLSKKTLTNNLKPSLSSRHPQGIWKPIGDVSMQPRRRGYSTYFNQANQRIPKANAANCTN